MTQSTYFNQVKNVLKVLQGYTKGIRFIALLTMLCTIGVGQMWGADVTYVFEDATDNPGNANDWLTADIDSYTSWSATKGGSNNPKYYNTGNGLRVYNGGKFTITSSKTLASITLTFSGTGYTFQSTNTANPQIVTPNAKSYEWSVGRTCRLQKIEITYAAGSSTPTPSLSATPTTIDFGTVEQGATIANKTVAINFANLTGQVNYSGLSNPFTATGTVSNSGDNITIAANTATIGEYSQTLTITSAADSKTAEVTVKMNIVAPFEGKKLVFDFVTHPSGWPAAKANATEGSYVYTLDEVDYTFSHTKSGDGIYLGGTSKTSGYLMLASGNKLGLPAIKGYKLVKVDGTLNGSGTPSTASQVSITNAGGTVISGGAAQTWDTKGGTKTYNLTDTEANTVYYLTVANKNLQMITLALYYEEVAGAVEIPSAPAFTVAGGSYYGTQSIEITCATAGANIYYTLDGSVPTSSSTPYTGAISISETKTLKAIAVKDEKVSPVASATYTINLPLTTMDQIFAKATAVGSTATSVEITFDNWVVSAVKEDGKTAFVTDGTKGFAIFDKDVHLGFSVGNILSGTVACEVQLYNGFAELTALTSATTGLNVTTGGTITTQELDAAGIAALTGINTGSLIKINGICSSSNLNYYVAGVQIYTSLYDFETLEVGAEYNITGIYQQFHSTKEMLPRSAEDIEKVVGLPTATISIADITMEIGQEKTIEATITPDAAQSTVQYAITSGNEYITLSGTTITAVAAGTATITATIAEKVGEYYGATKTFTVTVPTTYDVTWLVNGDEWAPTESVEEGTQITSLPNAPTDECGGKTFVGWSNQEVTDGNKPAVLFTDAVNSPTIADNTTFHAVFATPSDGGILTPELPRNIVYWEKQKITANEGISATTGYGTMTSNVTLSTKSNRTYQSTINKYAQIILSDLNLEDYTNINLSFWARGSQKGSITIKTNLSDDAITTFNITGTETLYVIENIPASATSITLSYGANSGSLFFGTVKIYENTTITYPFTKLTEDNTNGWTGDDWDGYYLITNAQNSLRALDGNSIGEKSYQDVIDEDGTINASISMAFLISSTQNGFTIKGVGDNLYLATDNNSLSVSSEAEYYTIGHNKVEAQSSKLSWNSDGPKFGFYGAIITSAPQLYKIMRFYSDYTTSCLNVNWTISEGGTLSTESGITTTVMPEEGYIFSEPAYTITDGSATVTQNGNIFTAVPTTDCTIQINMVQKTTYTITWMVNGKEYTEGTPSITVYADERVATLPTPPEPNAYCGDVFVGWTDAENGEYVHGTSNLYATPQEFPTASADQIFYAVFADYEQQ